MRTALALTAALLLVLPLSGQSAVGHGH